jgi:hypothetical protein
MSIIFHTNLALARPHVLRMPPWPESLGVPRIGERIEINMSSSTGDKRFDLDVVSVSYRCVHGGRYFAMVELHIPSYFPSIDEWLAWFKCHD